MATTEITIGSLFSGIGGLDLGVEAATGGRVIWHAESSQFCRDILARHWPDARSYYDVRKVDEKAERPTIICGGFPCQDISGAGKQRGIDGPQSGLWREFARVLRALRPPIVVVENVSALARRGLDRVLGDLAQCGYDAEWSCLRASDIGAPHLRRRLFLVAVQGSLSDSDKRQVRFVWKWARKQHRKPRSPKSRVDGGQLANANGVRRKRISEARPDSELPHGDDAARRTGPLEMADSHTNGLASDSETGQDCQGRSAVWSSRCHGFPPEQEDIAGWSRWISTGGPQPGVRRGADGVADWMDRIACLGNAVVPRQAEVAIRGLIDRMKDLG